MGHFWEMGVRMPLGGERLRGPDGEMNLIGARVFARRKSLRITRETLVARIASSTGGRWRPGTADLARIEGELRAVHTTELLVLAEVLETTPHDLLGGEGWNQVVSTATKRG